MLGSPGIWRSTRPEASQGSSSHTRQCLLTNEIAHNQNLHSPHVLPVKGKGQKQTPLLHRPPFWHSGSPKERQPKKPKHNVIQNHTIVICVSMAWPWCFDVHSFIEHLYPPKPGGQSQVPLALHVPPLAHTHSAVNKIRRRHSVHCMNAM